MSFRSTAVCKLTEEQNGLLQIDWMLNNCSKRSYERKHDTTKINETYCTIFGYRRLKDTVGFLQLTLMLNEIILKILCFERAGETNC